MLRTVGSKGNNIFIEFPGRELSRPAFEGSDTESIVEYYEAYINHVFGEDVQIEYLGTADYNDGEREDPVFRVNCKDYVEI